MTAPEPDSPWRGPEDATPTDLEARAPLTPEEHTDRPLTPEEHARRARLLRDVRMANQRQRP